MSMLRIARVSVRGMAPLASARRTNIHQTNKDDDLSWLEASDREMTAEERYAFQKQRQLLARQVEQLNTRYEEHHEKTRDQMKEHHEKNHAKLADLEKTLGELKAQLAQLKKE
eukprot:TRINITY_DN40_c0_g2_i1.p2 TRINITY_DN40_c0_g2~~TRINITY_DN40_c0_g2_i1.p2  ORF type:complete len:132 (+),score=62.96 TRINITY_DN40_c0_g2_i1:58-396(+)